MEIPVGAGLPAIAMYQAPSVVTDLPPSLASRVVAPQLPQWIVVFAKPARGSNITLINLPVQSLFARL